jgi:hypothetical protein
MNTATKAALGLVFSVSLVLLQRPVQAGELMKPILNINDMRVVVNYVSTGELVNLQRKFGAHIDLREIRQDYRHGFSILKTNRETGARTCEIYLPNDQAPREVDDEGTLTLGHELLHCMRGDYHR